MNDRAISLLEQYDIEVLRTRKGRGTFICDTKQGNVTFKEYFGNPKKLMVQQCILQQIRQTGLVRAEELLSCKDDRLYVKDNDGVCYILKTSVEGSECNIFDGRECVEAIRMLAKLHNCMQSVAWETVLPKENGTSNDCEESEPKAAEALLRELYTPISPLKEYEKHNRELIRVRTYLKKKGQKHIFEMRLLGVMDYFVNQAQRVTEQWRQVEKLWAVAEHKAKSEVSQFGKEPSGEASLQTMTFCHGDYQYHNIIRAQDGWHIINFEKLQADNPVRDIYLFMRKVMEKNNWVISLGREMLAAYEEIRRLDEYSRKNLYYRFAYPEKFWKIVNFYFNSAKAWIPEKNMEKLEKVIVQEREKQIFLKEVFGMPEQAKRSD